jgi:predicted phosphodiesterase
MNRVALAFCLSLLPAAAKAEDSAWVQAVANGYEARLVTAAATCPVLNTDKGDVAMTMRAPASADFPLVCAALLAAGVTKAQIGAATLPVPVANPQRILVVGDTGCRIKGAALQACNDPTAWPFPLVAAAAAKLKPDLVIHLGDYVYRESACPAGNAGCAGSPWGNNWTTWLADFYTPAAPLLAAAPIVLVRGNHEDCRRSGPGFQLLMAPGDAAGPCQVHEPLYTVDLGGLTLGVLDDAASDETDLDRTMAQTYADEIASLAQISTPVWLVHHRPTWAAISGPLDIPIGGNLTLMEASRLNAQKGAPLIPPSVELMLSGHIHTFEAINFNQPVPPQIVAGNGGDALYVTPRNLRGTQFIGHSGVTVADGLSVGGFGFLLMTKVADGATDGWTIDLYDPAGQPEGQCRLSTTGKGRLDCPNIKR